MIVQKTSVFPAAKETVFRKLQQLETLQYITKPYAAFEPIGEAVSTWAVGSTSACRFRIFGVIPYGTHTSGVSSREGNEHVPVWNHDIRLIEKDENHTQYTDRQCIYVRRPACYSAGSGAL